MSIFGTNRMYIILEWNFIFVCNDLSKPYYKIKCEINFLHTNDYLHWKNS